jgi:hypothetical protein
MASKSTSNTGTPGAANGTSGKPKRTQQIRMAFKLTREADPRLVPVMLAWGIGFFAVLLAVGFLINSPIFFGILGALVALAAMMFVFNRRAQRAMYLRIHGEVGAAASVLKGMLSERRGWQVTEGARFNRNQDMVHRVLGRPGFILVGEGNPNRLRAMFAEERKKLTRLFGPEVPIHEKDYIAGDGPDEVPIAKLYKTLGKLRPVIKPAQIVEYSQRLRAVGEREMPIPKGPVPRGGRMPRGQIR